VTVADEPELSARIASAIADHLGYDGMLTGFHLVAETIHSDGSTGWLFCTPEGQGMSQTMGLVEWARGVARYEQRRHLEVIERDED
jgi:hypothetical protein